MKKNLLSGILVAGAILATSFSVNAQLSTPTGTVMTNGAGSCAGCVGIGITMPTKKLEVFGDIKLQGNIFGGRNVLTANAPLSIYATNNHTDGAGIELFSNDNVSNPGSIEFYPGKGNTTTNKLGGYNFKINGGSNTLFSAVKINNLGSGIVRVGIMNDAPKAGLHISGGANGTAIIEGTLMVGGTTAVPVTCALTPNLKLLVNGTIGASEVKVSLATWCDYVFEKDYKLKSLKEVDAYIQANKHLPEVPSEKEVVENGVAMGEMMKIHMKKIEELTLYMIELQKQNEKLAAEVAELKK